MKTYDFAMQVKGAGDLTDELLNAIYEAGCDDATVSQSEGIVQIHFSREAESLTQAILSADAQVRTAIKTFKSIKIVAEDQE